MPTQLGEGRRPYGKIPKEAKEYTAVNIYGQLVVGVMSKQYEHTCILRDKKGVGHVVLLKDVGIKPRKSSDYKSKNDHYEEHEIKARGPIAIGPLRAKRNSF